MAAKSAQSRKPQHCLDDATCTLGQPGYNDRSSDSSYSHVSLLDAPAVMISIPESIPMERCHSFGSAHMVQVSTSTGSWSLQSIGAQGAC